MPFHRLRGPVLNTREATVASVACLPRNRRLIEFKLPGVIVAAQPFTACTGTPAPGVYEGMSTMPDMYANRMTPIEFGEPPSFTAFVYVLHCSDNTLYTGFTIQPEHRILQQAKGFGAAYTKKRLPVELVYLVGIVHTASISGIMQESALRAHIAIGKKTRTLNMDIILRINEMILENT